jgi:hypothetical protein
VKPARTRPTPRTRELPLGTIWEYRLARLRFYQGQFIRRSIDVWPPGLAGDKLAEVDGIAVSFDPLLRRRVEVLEGKTSAGRKGEIDRLIWIKGLAGLVGADDVTVAKLRLDDRARVLARRLDVGVLDEQSVAAAEVALGIGADDWVGLHDPYFGEYRIKPLRETLGKLESLNKAGKFLFGSYWLNDEFTRIKQLRTLFRLLIEQEATLDAAVAVLAAGEGALLLALAAYTVAAWQDQYSPDEYARFVTNELTSGVADVDSLRRLLRRIDDIHRQEIEKVHNTYTAGGVARLIVPLRNLENEILRTPEWTQGFLDLTSRLRGQPHLASAVLRTLDLRLARRLGSDRSSDKVQAFWSPQKDAVERMATTVERFLVSVWGAPERFFQNAAPSTNGTPPTAIQAGARIPKSANNNGAGTPEAGTDEEAVLRLS